MPAYDENRRAPKVPGLKRVTKNEATEGSDDKRQRALAKAREALADEVRAAQRPARASFAAVLGRKADVRRR